MINRLADLRDALGTSFMTTMTDAEYGVIFDLVARIEARMDGKETYATDRLQQQQRSTATGEPVALSS